MNAPPELLAHFPARDLYDRVRGFWGDIIFILQADGEPNKYRIEEAPGSFRTASVLYKRDHRIIEGLTHELLHLELYRQGYPLFHAMWERDRQFVSESNNCLQHQVMKCMFLELGFHQDLFESSRSPFSDFERTVVSQIEALAPFQGGANYTSKCLEFFTLREVEVRSGRFADNGAGGIEWIADHISGQ